ncbi:MAG: hypothetical protein HFI68_06505 [Lachnospiraceae bacterium]|nr:hypothetical protein [Lachnospiraceae bacterium]
MKKHKVKQITATSLIVLVLLLSSCGKKETSPSTESGENQTQTQEQTQNQSIDETASGGASAMKLASGQGRQETISPVDYGIPEEGVIRAMTLSDTYGNLYYVDVNIGTFFTAPIPDDLTDADGNPLSPEAVKAGCVVDIYGNGIMLESYPGQYPGVTKMVMVKEGTPEDAAPFQHLVDEISAPADPSEPPSVNAEYRTDLVAATVILTRGNYEWSYIDESGETQHVIACGSHILQWPELNDISIDESVANGLELKLTSSYKPQSISVTRFPLELWEKEASQENTTENTGEPVEVQDTEEGFTMTAEAGYVYLIEATWEEGRVEFGFYTK